MLGNDLVERRFEWNGGNLKTRSLEDKTTGAKHVAAGRCPDFVFTPNAAGKGAGGRLEVERIPQSVCAPAYLRARVEYTLDGLDIRREFHIWADAPAISCHTWLRLSWAAAPLRLRWNARRRGQRRRPLNI